MDEPLTTSAVETAHESRPEPARGESLQAELVRLRVDLNRIAHEVRMKSKGAGAEVHVERRALERELRRFGTEVDLVIDRTREDLAVVGRDLQTRFTKLAQRIAFPPS